MSFFDEIGKKLWPFPSGFYCYVAQKYESIAPTLLHQEVLSPVSIQPALRTFC